MTYQELLDTTREKKRKAIRDLNKALKDPRTGFLVKAEIERKPGTVAWLYLAKDFCETLYWNFEDIMNSLDRYDQMGVASIYMAYEDDDPDLYELLPVEAQLFTEEA